MSLNRYQIQAIRRLLFLSVVEAARNVAIDDEHPTGVSERAWNRWESGEKLIPDRIGEKLKSLLLLREAEILRITHNARKGYFFALWYEHCSDCLPLMLKCDGVFPTVIDWKMSQSVAAAITERDGAVVCFDKAAFEEWRQQQKEIEPDSIALRERWAIETQFQAA